MDCLSRVNLSSANARQCVTCLTSKTYHFISAIPHLFEISVKLHPDFSARPKPIYRAILEVCCKRWPNPTKAEMGPLSILKDFCLPCRFSHPSLHLAGISCRQQAEGRRIPPACWNMKSWISVGRNKSYSHFPPILEVNAQNKMCFVTSLCLIRLLNFSWY